ncbi:hypothetical protein QBC35DRAFT_535630 [Podospora australis]|uniref:Uncharacterized protein n=1 Tax=Podospora australis TaxID=1536484 RepID=A0AAN6WNT0_9PEZI|nr:hypothetical protein QBC35DRAFT_535630 [Podospora australis]
MTEEEVSQPTPEAEVDQPGTPPDGSSPEAILVEKMLAALEEDTEQENKDVTVGPDLEEGAPAVSPQSRTHHDRMLEEMLVPDFFENENLFNPSPEDHGFRAFLNQIFQDPLMLVTRAGNHDEPRQPAPKRRKPSESPKEKRPRFSVEYTEHKYSTKSPPNAASTDLTTRRVFGHSSTKPISVIWPDGDLSSQVNWYRMISTLRREIIQGMAESGISWTWLQQAQADTDKKWWQGHLNGIFQLLRILGLFRNGLWRFKGAIASLLKASWSTAFRIEDCVSFPKTALGSSVDDVIVTVPPTRELFFEDRSGSLEVRQDGKVAWITLDPDTEKILTEGELALKLMISMADVMRDFWSKLQQVETRLKQIRKHLDSLTAFVPCLEMTAKQADDPNNLEPSPGISLLGQFYTSGKLGTIKECLGWLSDTEDDDGGLLSLEKTVETEVSAVRDTTLDIFCNVNALAPLISGPCSAEVLSCQREMWGSRLQNMRAQWWRFREYPPPAHDLDPEGVQEAWMRCMQSLVQYRGCLSNVALRWGKNYNTLVALGVRHDDWIDGAPQGSAQG